MLSQPDPSLVPGTDLDVREISLGHLVPHLNVLGRQDHDGGAAEIFVDVAVAAVVQQANSGVETVTNRSGPVCKLGLWRFAAE